MNIFTILFVVLICLPIFLALYLLPSIIAGYRQHRMFSAILVVNVAFGWTFAGWMIALALAYTDDQRRF